MVHNARGHGGLRKAAGARQKVSFKDIINFWSASAAIFSRLCVRCKNEPVRAVY